jgi:AcrR family transcriptional regulator
MKRKIKLEPRKRPKQARSLQMKEDILTAAIRVLEGCGAPKFTTIRVAEAAGISVGSLYQYFPNKESLLFSLHEREMRKSWDFVRTVLADEKRSAREKVRSITHHFFEAEAGEPPQMRILLEDVQSYFRDTKEYRELAAEVGSGFREFISKVISAKKNIEFSADLLMTTIEGIGKSVAGRGYTSQEIRKWSAACAEMNGVRQQYPACRSLTIN